jgi:ribosomal-protein-alanine N-acetyltransferase
MPAIRRGGTGDLEAVAAIQGESPEAAHWRVEQYLQYDFRVAVSGETASGFLVARSLTPGEYEILNLAVALEFRRKGIARGLLAAFLSSVKGAVYLEVRESNGAALNLYKSMGFQEVGVRKEYYQSPRESGIVLKFHSC